MGVYERLYNELRKRFSDEEIAESMMIPEELSKEEEHKAQKEMLAFRMKLLKEKSEEKRIYADLLRFKFLIEDYVENGSFDPGKTFGKQLEEYVSILGRTKKRLSEDLAVHYTRLSRIINDREEPNIELLYRLEKHSANLIPAVYWWKLVMKKQEFHLNQDKKTRITEAAKVKNAIQISS